MARSFTGTNNNISFGDTTIIDGLTSLTMSIMLCPQNGFASNRRLFHKVTSGSNILWLSDNGAGQFTFNVYDGSHTLFGRTTNTVVSLGNWYNVVFRWEGGNNATIWVDGVSAALTYVTTGNPTSIANNSAALRLGASPSNNGYYGYYAEAAIWNHVISDESVQSLANRYAPPLVEPNNLIFYVPLWGNTTENDWAAQLTGTLGGTTPPTVVDHPAMVYPRRRKSVFFQRNTLKYQHTRRQRDRLACVYDNPDAYVW